MIDLPVPLAKEALPLYDQQTSKENSLFDCYVMLAARHSSVDGIFSFDGGSKQNGCMLIEDFLNVPPSS